MDPPGGWLRRSPRRRRPARWDQWRVSAGSSGFSGTPPSPRRGPAGPGVPSWLPCSPQPPSRPAQEPPCRSPPRSPQAAYGRIWGLSAAAKPMAAGRCQRRNHSPGTTAAEQRQRRTERPGSYPRPAGTTSSRSDRLAAAGHHHQRVSAAAELPTDNQWPLLAQPSLPPGRHPSRWRPACSQRYSLRLGCSSVNASGS